MKILTETNYKAFKFLKGNRPIIPAKIKRLIDALQSGLNLFPYAPIMVNDDMYVIDGQHRLKACEKMKLPVYYVVVPKISLVQIAQLNATATRWKTSDFFNCFIETGNKDYKTLQMFQDKYDLSINIAVQLLMNGSLNEGGTGSETFKEGKFAVRHLEKAEKIMKHVMDYEPICEEKALKHRSFIRAVQLLMASPEYNHKEVVEKLKQKKLLILTKGNHREYIYHIEELYNKGASIRKIIYKSAKA
jgi:hypothetical protein